MVNGLQLGFRVMHNTVFTLLERSSAEVILVCDCVCVCMCVCVRQPGCLRPRAEACQ